ncbi:hypothetical protein [Pseudoalteromonas umbrosa]|uniref:hypothetical protein n=1 Tax=Pseudoalteromonas umbrosa TaxID=3048489 RepID=UPI0024C2EA16|nr:hypothetical protein [Pseudoalteromonas sp. B95]MDK1289836.1 hypothetical protein [Pseudoalteromonas sp. B95]
MENTALSIVTMGITGVLGALILYFVVKVALVAIFNSAEPFFTHAISIAIFVVGLMSYHGFSLNPFAGASSMGDIANGITYAMHVFVLIAGWIGGIRLTNLIDN